MPVWVKKYWTIFDVASTELRAALRDVAEPSSRGKEVLLVSFYRAHRERLPSDVHAGPTWVL